MMRFAISVHRWLGVALCLPFLIWFPSAVGMMYSDFPSVTAEDRLARSPALDASAIHVSPAEAYAALRTSEPPTDVRLNTFDGRPVYRFRFGRSERVVYADTADVRGDATPASMRRVAARWTQQPESDALVEPVDEVDQWTVQSPLRTLRPLWKFSWRDGQQVYIAQESGEVVQYTTAAARVGAYLGPIPHWLYFTALRKRQLAWTRVVVWSSGAATLAAALGIAIGVWRSAGARRIPYRGQKWWHTAFGLIFGVGAATWAFSGMLSMDPFPIEGDDPPPLRLRGPVRPADFAPRDPRGALAVLAPIGAKELEFATALGERVYIAKTDRGETRVVPLEGPPRSELDRDRMRAMIPGAEISTIDRYDAYYRDRRRERPLPVVLAQLGDADRTRYYIDPRSARVVATYSSRHWVTRWLYHGLHSLDFPWLYDRRPLWDVVVIAFMLGGTALSVTSVILAWRVLRTSI